MNENRFPLAQEAERLAKEYGFTYDPVFGTWRSSPGKFEGEAWYAPYYFNAMLEGDGESIYANDDTEGDGENIYADIGSVANCGTLFQVDAEESEVFGLECGDWVLLRESDCGFVFVTVHETRDAAEKRFNDWIGG